MGFWSSTDARLAWGSSLQFGGVGVGERGAAGEGRDRGGSERRITHDGLLETLIVKYHYIYFFQWPEIEKPYLFVNVRPFSEA